MGPAPKQSAAAFSDHVYAALFGVSAYETTAVPHLQTAASDCKELALVLADQAGCALARAHIWCLTDNEVTKRKVSDTLDELIGQCGPHDIVFIFLAGHAQIVEGEFLFCTFEFNPEKPRQTSLTGTELESKLSQLRSRGTTVVLDCCRSAGYAESAPMYFRTLDQQDFRILLSASRRGQSSYELPDGHGTLFSRHLIGVLAGRESVGSVPGQIYFSDLYSHLQEQVREDLEARFDGVPAQEPIVVGSFGKDPLLFVHQRLSLQQISVRTLRYSRQYVRRLFRRTLISIACLLLFAFGTHYSVLQKTQYAQLQDNVLTVYSGNPRLNAYGFPRRLWSFRLSPAAVLDGPLARSQPVVSDLGKPALPLVIPQLRDSWKALVLASLGQTREALKFAKATIENSKEDTYIRERAIGMVADNPNPGDVEVLASMHADEKIRPAILGALARLDSRKALETVSLYIDSTESSIGAEASDAHQAVLLNLEGSCIPEIGEYLSGLTSRKDFNVLVPVWIDTAVRLGCHVSPQTIARVYSLAPFDGVDAKMVAMFEAIHKSKGLVPVIKRALVHRNSLNSSQLSAGLQALNIIAPDYTPESVVQLLFNRDSDVRAAAARMLIHKPSKYLPTLARVAHNDPHVAAELIGANVVPDHLAEQAFNVARNDAVSLVALLKAIQHSRETRVVPEVERLLDYQNPAVCFQAARTFRLLNWKTPAMAHLVSNQWDQVRLEGLRYQVQEERVSGFKAVVQDLAMPFGLAGGSIRIFAGQKLNSEELATLRRLNQQTGSQRVEAIALLAAYGDIADAVKLLEDPDAEVRATAARAVGFNSELDAIAKKLSPGIWPSESPFEIDRQLRLRKRIQSELMSVPVATRCTLIDVLRFTYDEKIPLGLELWLQESQDKWETNCIGTLFQ